jgi:putative photosynthetic complex assembly protein
MSELATSRPFPRGVLLGAGALIGLTMALIMIDRMGRPDFTPSLADQAVASRELRFVDRAVGGVSVIDSQAGREVAAYEPGEGGFVRGVLRSLMRARMQNGIGADGPFQLFQLPDGQLVLADPATGETVYIGAFGQTQVDTFADLMAAEGSQAGAKP